MNKRKLTDQEVKYNKKGIERAIKEIDGAQYDIDYNTLQVEKGIDVKCVRMKNIARTSISEAESNLNIAQGIKKSLQDQIDYGVEVKEQEEEKVEQKEEE